jgi:hypothetical protein
MGADLWGESPLRWRWPEPLAKGKGVTARWGLKEAGRQTREPMNKKRIGGGVVLGESAKHDEARAIRRAAT